MFGLILAAETILGYSVSKLLDQPFISFVTQEQLERTCNQLEQVRSGTPVTFETAVYHKSGYRVDLNVTAVPVELQPNSKGNILICQDITERKRGDEQVRYMAYYDDMTGLPNRRMFRDQLE